MSIKGFFYVIGMTFSDINSGWSVWDRAEIEGLCNVPGEK